MNPRDSFHIAGSEMEHTLSKNQEAVAGEKGGQFKTANETAKNIRHNPNTWISLEQAFETYDMFVKHRGGPVAMER